MTPKVRVAICHYWLVSSRGGEAVLEALLDIYPDADIFTHVLDEREVSRRISSRVKQCTFIARLPFAKRLYQFYLPFMPLALKMLNLSDYDLVVSSESGPAKGIVTAPGALHICYCHSPMRYLWDQADTYLQSMGPLKSLVFRILLPALRRWDVASAQLPDTIVTNSHFVAGRVRHYWGREADIIYPPVDTGRFSVGDHVGEYYLYFGQLVAYKRPDIVVEAFNASGRPLVIAGEGDMLEILRQQANSNISFRGRVDDSEAVRLMQQCQALVFPGIEDFGIVPLEAMACGRPVIAFGQGGVLDTIIDGTTGLLFYQQTAAGLNQALDRYESRQHEFDVKSIVEHARAFDRRRFVAEFSSYVNAKLSVSDNHSAQITSSSDGDLTS